MQEGLHSLERETGSWSGETEVTDQQACGFRVLAHAFRVWAMQLQGFYPCDFVGSAHAASGTVMCGSVSACAGLEKDVRAFTFHRRT